MARGGSIVFVIRPRIALQRFFTPHAGWREIPVEAWAAAALGLAWAIFFGAAPFHPWHDLAFACYGWAILRRFPPPGRIAMGPLLLAIGGGTLFLWLPLVEAGAKRAASSPWHPRIEILFPTIALAAVLGIVTRSGRPAVLIIGAMIGILTLGHVVMGQRWWSSAPLAAFVHLVVLLAMLWRLADLRRMDGRCPHCGYDARELERCPECGSLVPPAEE